MKQWSVVRQCKGRLFWPKMREQIKKLYNDCSNCTEHRISRPQKTNEIDYKNVFENFYPNQMVEIDYCQKGTQDYLVIACSLTGFIQVFETKDKGAAQAVLKMRQWGAIWGLPYIVKSDRGPGFHEAFEEGMAKFGVKVIHSCSYKQHSPMGWRREVCAH